MLITDSVQGWGSKVNFTDSNDVFVGYDMGQCCCEDADYFLSYSQTTKAYEAQDHLNGVSYEGYVFDTEFFQDVDDDLEDGGHVCFKLIKQNSPDIYLHLYNNHNGYYGHGFDSNIKGIQWQYGCL